MFLNHNRVGEVREDILKVQAQRRELDIVLSDKM